MSTTLPMAGDFVARAKRIDGVRRRVAELPTASREVAEELQSAIEEHVAAVLRTVVTTLRADERGRELLYDLVEDAEVHAALVKAGLVRQTVAMRAMQVLEGVRPYIQSHGGDLELVGIEDGVAQVRLSGSCKGCSASKVTLHQVVRDALVEHVPEITDVVDADPAPVTHDAPTGGIALPMVQVPGRATAS